MTLAGSKQLRSQKPTPVRARYTEEITMPRKRAGGNRDGSGNRERRGAGMGTWTGTRTEGGGGGGQIRKTH